MARTFRPFPNRRGTQAPAKGVRVTGLCGSRIAPGVEFYFPTASTAPADVATGKRKTRYVTVKGGKKAAQQELRRLLSTVDEGRFVEPSKLTVAQYLEQWLDDHARHRVSGKTFERYRELLRLHVVPGHDSSPGPNHCIFSHATARCEPAVCRRRR